MNHETASPAPAGGRSRRSFLCDLTLAGTLATVAGPCAIAQTALERKTTTAVMAPVEGERAYWVRLLAQVADPVLRHLAANQLKARMPVEVPTGNPATRRPVTHLEAVGRTIAGLAPWLELTEKTGDEAATTATFTGWTQRGLAHITDPAAADRLDFTAGEQCLVDAAFLAYGLILAPRALWQPLDADVKTRLIAAMQSTRRFPPGNSNWLLFSAMIEAFLAQAGAGWRAGPIDRAVQAHLSWYKGDGTYGDGPNFHWDYYNSYVIQPFLTTVLATMRPVSPQWNDCADVVEARAVRYAAVQERLIAPDGTFPTLGRSLAYRCGAFHHLAHQAWRGALPAELAPAQARSALTAVIRRTLEAPGTFDADGWLRVGLAGHQPSLAEPYISTGSLYLCTLAFHPLGLPASAPFWGDSAIDWTQRRIWSGQNQPADHALKEK
ncbi:MAG TPA: DUF2264 domain-containing protein [Opitutaceae bacterium]|nr:DUF2264 domain-containing protein [Opitutaceae bacterium]